MSDSPQGGNLLHEERRFPPSPEFQRTAVAKPELYAAAAKDRVGFWADQARELLHWHTAFAQTLDWSNPPFARWFADGALNVAYNCLDRHVEAGLGDRVALQCEGEPGDSRAITYAELTTEVKKAANMLIAHGVKAGDRVIVYMPLIPEAVIAMLAVARLGAIHSVVFGGFSAESLRARIDDADASIVITADGGHRKGSVFALKPAVDQALADGKTNVRSVIVVKRGGNDVEWREGLDFWWHDEIAAQSSEHTAEAFEAENPLFILYTSGTTGKPKGILHTSGGYLTQAAFTHKNIFDLHPETDVYWCTADVGWITGHSYIVYGPLSNGATTLMYEGAPRPAKPGAFWEVIEKHRVTIFYTAPTAIRAFMKNGRAVPDRYDMSSLRILGTVGEPINPEAWMWYRDVIGGDRCPVVDTWWQTETGGVMISPLPGATPTKPGSATLPLPGIVADVVDLEGNSVPTGQGGYLAVRRPWPGMMRTVHGDPDRFRSSYWEHIRPADGSWLYFAGDGARRDADGYFWVMGRVDDVINVSGHRLGTMEIESALVSHPSVAEAAVVGRPDDLKGEGIVAFVTLDVGVEGDAALEAELRRHVGLEIGPIARPDIIRFTDALPKTRSGKIMRRILRSLASGQELSGDTSTLEDRSVLDQLRV